MKISELKSLSLFAIKLLRKETEITMFDSPYRHHRISSKHELDVIDMELDRREGLKTTKTIFYKIITPSTFADITTVEREWKIFEGTEEKTYMMQQSIRNLKEANIALENFGKTNPRMTEENIAHWKERRDLCKIVRVTYIEEEDVYSKHDFK